MIGEIVDADRERLRYTRAFEREGRRVTERVRVDVEPIYAEHARDDRDRSGARIGRVVRIGVGRRDRIAGGKVEVESIGDERVRRTGERRQIVGDPVDLERARNERGADMRRVDDLDVHQIGVGIAGDSVTVSIDEHRRRLLTRRGSSTADTYLDRNPRRIGVVRRILIDRDDRVSRQDAEGRDAGVDIDQVDARHRDEVTAGDAGLKEIDRSPAAVPRVEDVQLRQIPVVEDVRIAEEDVHRMELITAVIAAPRIERHRSERDILLAVPIGADPLAAVQVLILVRIDNLDEDAVGVDVTLHAVPVPIEEVHIDGIGATVVNLGVGHFHRVERDVVRHAHPLDLRRERRSRIGIA